MARHEILLPLKYNDGTEVEAEKFQETRRELVAQFGALTMDPPSVSGLWISGEQEYQDELIRFVIDTQASPQTEEFFQEFKERLKERFRQIEVWITASPIRLI